MAITMTNTHDLRSTGPTMRVEQAAALIGISRTTAYTEAQRYRDSNGQEGLPNIKLGERVLVLTSALAALLQLPVANDTP